MKVYVVDHNSVHRVLIERLINSLLPGSEITMAQTHDNHNEHASEADLIIVSGGTWLVHKNPNTHTRIMSNLLEHKKPIFAICLGAEAVIHFFDGKLTEMNYRHQGITEIEIIDDGLQKSLGRTRIKVYEWHKWAITKLPDNMLALAISREGVEYFRHRNFPIWGFQFHPEARRGKNEGYLLFEHALKQAGVKKINVEKVAERP